MRHKDIAKPFLKWAGGKKQLVPAILGRFPEEFKYSKFTYIEPFVGGGAVLFAILNHFANIDKVIINDINSDLMNVYKTIKYKVSALINILKKIETEYYSYSDNQQDKEAYYYTKRDLFNSRKSDRIYQSALFIFLNRTCFNGLYRVNKDNKFNVPMGNYKKPLICDEQNLRSVSRLLKKVKILNNDFEKTLLYASDNTLFYFDPPYKPLTKTSSFNAYSKNNFNDDEQIRLSAFCSKLDKLGYKWILSNSDVKGKDSKNNFFDKLYADYHIVRVLARRNINANPDKRGQLTELLIANYKNEKIMSIA